MDEETEKQCLAEINALIESRHKDICRNYPKIRDSYLNGYDGDTEINPIRHEISICIIFGLYQAAITLTNHIIEKYLKIALIYKNADFNADGRTTLEKIANATAKSTADYNSNDMDRNINAACSQGIITKDDKKELSRIRESLRNAYSHADALKTHGNASIPATSVKLTDSGFAVEGQDIAQIALLPMFQGIAQCKHAEANAIPYFQFVDSLIRRTRTNIFPRNRDNNNV